MIGLRCLGCGRRIELAASYEDYDGPIRCWTCSALLEVSLREGRLRSMRTGDTNRPAADGPALDPVAPSCGNE